MYNFRPSESFYARPFGLTVNIYYKDLVSFGGQSGRRERRGEVVCGREEVEIWYVGGSGCLICSITNCHRMIASTGMLFSTLLSTLLNRRKALTLKRECERVPL